MYPRRPEIGLQQLRAFVVVAEELHFRRAAEILGMAQPPLSQLIKRLEATVGCSLLERNTRSVELTEAGMAFLASAKLVLYQASDGLKLARKIGRGDAGTLAFGFTPSVAVSAVPRVVRAMALRQPDIELELSQFISEPLCEALRNGQLDAGLLRDPEPDDALSIEPVFEEAFIAILPDGHPEAASSGPLQLSLAHDDFVLFPRDTGSCIYERVMGFCREAGFQPRIIQRTTGWETNVALVSAGLGVSILPRCVENLKLPNVAFREIENVPPRVIALAWRKGDSRSRLRHFITTVRALAGLNDEGALNA